MGKSIGIVLAGGIGSRFDNDCPKQYFKIMGKEMIAYSIDAFSAARKVDDFIVVLNPGEFENNRIVREYGVNVVCGGVTRNWSLKNALEYIENKWPDCDKVIENNAACPLTRPATIDRYLDLLDSYDWVQTASRITDALGSYKNRDVFREDFFLIQAPDAYRFGMLNESFDPDCPNGHPAVQLPESARGCNVFHSTPIVKITTKYDIVLVEHMLGVAGEANIDTMTVQSI